MALVARGIDEVDGRGGGLVVTRAGLWRIALVTGFAGAIEVLCLTGTIDKITMQAPHRMLVDLAKMIASGSMNAAIAKTLTNAVLAFLPAIAVGILTAVALFPFKRVRNVLDPLFATYYAIPVFAFYPLLIVMLGLGDAPQILLGFMLAVVAVIINTLNGLDRVPRVLIKTARVNRMGPLATAFGVMLPSAAPYVLTGVKLAVAYSLIGIIGAEFIMSRGGMGYEISFAYNNFDNAIMYPLILLILVVSIGVNTLLGLWEKRLMLRKSGR